MKSIKEILNGAVTLGPIEVRGWIKTHRASKKVAFIELTDGTSVRGLQLVLDPLSENYQAVAALLSTGASVKATGELKESPAKGQKYEMQVSTLSVVGSADPETYPLQKKEHTLEMLRENLHFRARTNTLGAVFRLRSLISFLVHEFYQTRGFYYLQSPIITSSDCEGAGQMFKVSTLDLLNVPKAEGKVNYNEDFFKTAAHLTVSGQLEGEAFALALSKIYTFGPTFRAENSNTTRHLAEFWMIEPEVAFAELADNIELAGDFVRFLVSETFKRGQEDLEFLHGREWVEKTLRADLETVINKKPEVLDYTSAIKVLESASQKFEYPVSWGIDLQSEHERYLTEQYVKGPVFVVNYPTEIKAFYMKQNEDGKTVRAMDLLVPGLGEIIGGSQREDDYDKLRLRMQGVGLIPEDYQWYLDLRRYGGVPHAGFGLGFERLLMYVTGMTNIRDVIAYPRYPGHAG